MLVKIIIFIYLLLIQYKAFKNPKYMHDIRCYKINNFTVYHRVHEYIKLNLWKTGKYICDCL